MNLRTLNLNFLGASFVISPVVYCGISTPPLFSEEINFLQLEDPIMASTLQGKKPREIEVLSGCIMCYLQMCTSLRHEETHG